MLSLVFCFPLLLVVAANAPALVDAFSNNIIPTNNRSSELHRRRAANNIIDRTMSTAKKLKTNGGDDDDSPPTRPHSIRAGFVGCGTIASAIAAGLATPDNAPHLARRGLSVSSVCVTRRSESKSTKLKENFPELVTVCDSAVEVVEKSDVLFLCVLPQQVDGVMRDLSEKGVWRNDEHTLVSLVSTSKVDDLIQKSGLPRNRVYKMICLPAIAEREGCALLQPASKADGGENYPPASIDVKSMLEALGGCVECADDDRMNTLMVTTSMMGPVYGVMRNNLNWLVKQGVPPEDASYFVGRSYLSMVQDAERDCQDPKRFDALIEEQTPGGLNEQTLRNLEKQRVFDSYDRAMDAVFSRLQGKSDGSLPSNP